MSDTTNSAALAEIEALIAACEEDFCNAVTEDPEYGCDDDESVGGGDLGDASVKFRHIRRARSVLRRLAETNASTFQARVHPWLLACFGAEIAADREERNHRFLEEALELVQALGCTRSEAHQLVDYVFGRAVGEPTQEVGGVMVTLAALCLASSLDMHEAGEIELARIWTKVEQIRAKQAAKPKHSPLPQVVDELWPETAIEAIKAELSDPNKVHLMMLRGVIAQPSVAQIKHIYGDALATETVAVHDVLAERRRQVEVEGWTAKHDDRYTNMEIAYAASAYAGPVWRDDDKSQLPIQWPFSAERWKWSPENVRRMIVKAAAMLLAEIERIDRAAERETGR